MSKPRTQTIDIDGTILEDRELTDAEIAANAARMAALEQAQIEAAQKRQAALAKLEALGFDEDDLKALGL